MYVEAENQELQELLSQIQSSTNSDQDKVCNSDNITIATQITESSNNNNNNNNNVGKYRFSPAARVSTHDESNGNSNSRDFTNVFNSIKEMSPANLESYTCYAALLNHDLALAETVNETNNHISYNEDNSESTSHALQIFEITPDLSSFASNEPCSLIDDKSESNDNECELHMRNSHTLEIPQEEEDDKENDDINNSSDHNDNSKFSNAVETSSEEIQLQESDLFLELMRQQSSESSSYEESASSFINGLVLEQLQPQTASEQEHEEQLASLNNTKLYKGENMQIHMFDVSERTPNVKMPHSLLSASDESQAQTCTNNSSQWNENVCSSPVNNNNANNRSNSNSSVKSYTLSQVIINPTTKQKSPIVDRGLCVIKENDEDETNFVNCSNNKNITKITLVSDKPSPTHYTSAFNNNANVNMCSPYSRQRGLFLTSKPESHLVSNESSRPVISITAPSIKEVTILTSNPTQQLQNYAQLDRESIPCHTNTGSVTKQYEEKEEEEEEEEREERGIAHKEHEEWRNDVEEEMIALAQSPSTTRWSAFTHIHEGNHTIPPSVTISSSNNNNNNNKLPQPCISSTPVLLNNNNTNNTTFPPQVNTTSVNQILTNAYQQMAASVFNNNGNNYYNNNTNTISPHNNSCTPYQSQAAHFLSFTPESSKRMNASQTIHNTNTAAHPSVNVKTGSNSVNGNNSLTKSMAAPRVNIFALPSPPRSSSAMTPHDVLPLNTSELPLSQTYNKNNNNVCEQEEEEEKTTFFSSIAKLTHNTQIRNTVEEMMRTNHDNSVAFHHEQLNKTSGSIPFNLVHHDTWSPNRQPIGMTNISERTKVSKMNFNHNNNNMRENTFVHRPCSAIVSNESAPSLRPIQRPCSAFTSFNINNNKSSNTSTSVNNNLDNVYVKDNVKVESNNMLDHHTEPKSNSSHIFFSTPEGYKQQQQEHQVGVASSTISPAGNESQNTQLYMNLSNTLTPSQQQHNNNSTHILQRPLMQTATPNKFSSFYSISHRSTPGKVCISPLGLTSPQNTLGRTSSVHNNNITNSNKKNANNMISPSATRHAFIYGNDNTESRGMTPSLTPVLAMLMGQTRFTPVQGNVVGSATSTSNTTGVSGAYTFYSSTPTHATPSRANDVHGNTPNITYIGGNNKAINEMNNEKPEEEEQKTKEELQYSMALAMQEKQRLSALFNHRHSPLESMDTATNNNNVISSKAGMNKVKMDSIAQKVLAMSRDQQGCRLLQAVLHNEVIETKTFPINNIINTPTTTTNKDNNKDETNLLITNNAATNVKCKNEQAMRFASSIPVQRILYAVEPVLHEVMADAYGNFLIQKLLEVAPDTERARILALPSLQNNLCNVAASPHGTFAVQRLIETLRNEEEEEIVFCALSRNLLLLLTDVNGGHVLYKMMSFIKQQYYTPVPSALCKTSLTISSNFTNNKNNTATINSNNVNGMGYCTSPGTPESSLKSNSLSQEEEQSVTYFRNIRRKVNFLYMGILEHLLHICRHRQGCCIVQKCIDFFSQLFPAKDGKDEYLLWEQMQSTMHQSNNNILNSVNTARGSYINASSSFVEGMTTNMHETEENCFLGIIRRLIPHIVTLSTDPFGNYVVTHAVEVCFATGNIALVDVMALQLQGKLITLCKNKFASNVIEHVLRHCNERRIRALCRVLMEPQPALSRSNAPSFTIMSPLHNSSPGQINANVNNIGINSYNNTYGANTVTSSLVIPLIELAMDAYGNYVVQTLLTVAPVDELVYTSNVKEINIDSNDVQSNLLSGSPYVMSARSLPFNDKPMAGVNSNMTRSLVMSGQCGMLPLLQAHLPELLERNFGKKLETKIDLALLRVSQHSHNYR